MGQIIAHRLLPRQPPELTAQRQNRHQIGNRHQTVDDLSHRPDHPGIQRRPKQNSDPLADAEGPPADPSEEILRTPPGIKAPSQDRRQGKEHQTAAEHRADPVSKAAGQRLGRQLRPHSLAPGDRDPAGQDHKRRQRADDHGIEKNLHDPHEPLLRRVVRFRRAVGDGGGAHAGLVGECPPGHADAHSGHHAPQHAAGDCTRIKCAGKNRLDGNAHSFPTQ